MPSLSDSFQKKIKQVPLLTPQEEIDLGRQLVQARTLGLEKERIRIRNKFMSHNMRLVLKVMGRFKYSSVSPEDLFSEGVIGLMRAVDKYDPERGFRFNTYAWAWIHQGMAGFIRAKGNNVHVPGHVLEDYSKVRRARNKLGHDASIEMLAKETKLTADQVLHAILSVGKEMSMTQPLIEDMLLEDVMADDDMETGFDRILSAENMKLIEQHLSVLNSRERDIIEKRFGLNGHEPMTLHEIGLEQNVSRERIRQIEAGAMRRMSRDAKAN